MPMNDPLNSRQPNAGAFKRLACVQTLKYSEEFADILHIIFDSIISNKHDYLILILFQASYCDLGPRTRTGEFSRVRNQNDECQPQHGAVSIPGGQATDPPNDIARGRVGPNFV